MEVIWSQRAENDYYQQIDYLMENWEEDVALKFVDQVFQIIEHLVTHPRMYPITNYQGIRKALVNQYISLFYQIQEGRIILLRFWPNAQDPEQLDF